MSNSIFLKRFPWAIALRVFALTIILLITFLNIQWLPMQIHELKQGEVQGLYLEFTGDAGKVVVGSAGFEHTGYSGEAIVNSADKEANENGIFAGGIVLNSEALTKGEIGTPVTLFVKHGDLPVREIKLVRRQTDPPIPTISGFLGLSPRVRMYLAIIVLCAAVLLTGMGGIVAFWFQSDAWLAFFVVGAITNFFTPMQANPSWLLFWSYFPAGLILFLILFPNGRLNPKWSWMLVFLPLSQNINLNVFGQANFHIWPEYVYGFFSSYGVVLFLAIVGSIAYRYRKALTLAERRWTTGLIAGLIFISTWRQWLIFFGTSIDTIQHLNSLMFLPQGEIWGLHHPLFGYVGPISFLLILGIVLRRYRNTFTLVEKQQAKWLALGFAISMPLVIVLKIFHSYYAYIRQYDPISTIGYITDRLFLFAWLAFAFSVVSAFRRYRLYDVDTFINRALVYGGLIVTAGAICLSSIIFIDQTVGPISSDQSAFLVIPISIFLIVVTYKPVRTWLQKLADKFFPPERVNFPEAFLEFTPDLRGYFTPSELSKMLAEKSVDQMEVTHASVFLKNKSRKLQHVKTASIIKKVPKPVIEKQALHKLEAGELIIPDSNSRYSMIVPLVVPRGQRLDFIGALMLGPRLNELGYSTEMKKSLKKFGEEIGTSLYVAQIKRRR